MRPWPGTRTSSPAQMPRGSRRVGTCPQPRAGIGTRAARPPHLCLPCSSLFCAQFSRVGSGSCPHPGLSRKPEGRGFPGASAEEVARGGCGAPVPGLGWRSAERQVGGQAGLGSGTRGRLALVESTAPAQRAPDQHSPTKPGAGSPCGGVRRAKTKATSSSNFAAEGADGKLRGAAPGDGHLADPRG